MLAASVRALVHVEGSSSLAVQEVIARARSLSHGRQRVYDAVVSAFAHNRHAEGRVERVLSLIEQMKREALDRGWDSLSNERTRVAMRFYATDASGVRRVELHPPRAGATTTLDG